MTTEKIVFVGGAMRSGTTILHRVLCTAEGSHPYIAESWYLLGQMRLYRDTMERYEVRGEDFFGPKANFDAHMRGLFEDHIDSVVRLHSPATLAVLKHPELTAQFPTLGRWFPRSHLVVNVRDPRDTIASIMVVMEKHRAAGVAPKSAERPAIGKLCNIFLGHYRWMEKAKPKIAERIVLARYETPMASPAETLHGLEQSLGVKFDMQRVMAFGEIREKSANLDPEHRLAHPFFGAYYSELYNKTLSDERIGRYAETLTAAEIAEIETRCAGFAAQYGYW